ncbi:hypothetical protein HBB16_00165 [Pseudonocardia sp. MCCB 268]|nr:hypothetical protein [Pseudonocardia cytotoxica]
MGTDSVPTSTESRSTSSTSSPRPIRAAVPHRPATGGPTPRTTSGSRWPRPSELADNRPLTGPASGERSGDLRRGRQR